MGVRFIGAGGKIAKDGYGLIGNDFYLQPYGTGKSHMRTRDVFYGIVVCKCSGFLPKNPGQLGLIDLVITTQEDGDWLSSRYINHGLYHLACIYLQKVTDFLNGMFIGRMDFFHRLKGNVIFLWYWSCFSPFAVGAVTAFPSPDQDIFTHRTWYHKLMGNVAAHSARIRLDYDVVKTASVEYAAVSVVHGFITLVESVVIHVKAIGVFHNKFLAAQDAESGSCLIPEFSLNLVESDWELPVGIHLIFYDIRNNFFVGRS